MSTIYYNSLKITSIHGLFFLIYYGTSVVIGGIITLNKCYYKIQLTCFSSQIYCSGTEFFLDSRFGL